MLSNKCTICKHLKAAIYYKQHYPITYLIVNNYLSGQPLIFKCEVFIYKKVLSMNFIHYYSHFSRIIFIIKFFFQSFFSSFSSYKLIKLNTSD